ncbi:MAG: CoA pyrophosphatase [Clostridiaceae bacterium]|nr:CoA pyrophosphatase [Clostridiaceae bacterium]
MDIDFSKLIHRKTTICDREIYREFSVLVPIIKTDNGHSLLFEIRSENLSKQPNEICFPGGKIERLENTQQAAVRETSEELLIPEASINVIAKLDTIVAPFNSILYPFIGELKEYFGTFNPEEVKETFIVPLSFFIDTAPLHHDINIRMKPKEDFPYHMIQEGRYYPWGKGQYPVYFYTYENKIIWGLTARIIKNLVSILIS